jgi:hypothetical protein
VKNDDFIGIYADKWFGEVQGYENICSNQIVPKLNGPMAFYNANTFVKWNIKQ